MNEALVKDDYGLDGGLNDYLDASDFVVPTRTVIQGNFSVKEVASQSGLQAGEKRPDAAPCSSITVTGNNHPTRRRTGRSARRKRHWTGSWTKRNPVRETP